MDSPHWPDQNGERLQAYAPGTVEEKIWNLQQDKRQTISDVLGEGIAKSPTRRIWPCSARIAAAGR